MLTMTTTTVGIFMYKCGLCPACVGKRLIIWRQQAISRMSHTKKSHMLLFFLAIILFVSYMWMVYPQIFCFARYHAWRPGHQLRIVREIPRLRRNLTFRDVCTKECVPDVESMLSSGYDVPYEPVTDESFTILTMKTHSEELFRRFLTHYAKMRRVNKIILHWIPSKGSVPDYEKQLDLGVPLVIKYVNSTDLLVRLKDLKEIRTEGVMVLEDDIILSRDETYQAFNLWTTHPWGIVGLYGGKQVQTGADGYKHSMVPFDHYSMIHRGAYIVHREHLRLYVDKYSPGVARIKCDDIALNFVVSNHCKCAAAYYIIRKSLYIRVTDKFEMLSSKWQYNADNNLCLNYFTNLFGGMPLKTKSCFW